MNKEQFLKKYNLTEDDWNELIRYEKVRERGSMNMFDYFKYLDNKIINFIVDHYAEFLKVYEIVKKAELDDIQN